MRQGWRVTVTKAYIVGGVDSSEDAIDAARGALDIEYAKRNHVTVDRVEGSWIAVPIASGPTEPELVRGLMNIVDDLELRIREMERRERELGVEVAHLRRLGVGPPFGTAMDKTAPIRVEPQRPTDDVGATERPVVGDEQRMCPPDPGVNVDHNE